jgi:hypothetical protein
MMEEGRMQTAVAEQMSQMEVDVELELDLGAVQLLLMADIQLF